PRGGLLGGDALDLAVEHGLHVGAPEQVRTDADRDPDVGIRGRNERSASAARDPRTRGVTGGEPRLIGGGGEAARLLDGHRRDEAGSARHAVMARAARGSDVERSEPVRLPKWGFEEGVAPIERGEAIAGQAAQGEVDRVNHSDGWSIWGRDRGLTTSAHQ